MTGQIETSTACTLDVSTHTYGLVHVVSVVRTQSMCLNARRALCLPITVLTVLYRACVCNITYLQCISIVRVLV